MSELSISLTKKRILLETYSENELNGIEERHPELQRARETITASSHQDNAESRDIRQQGYTSGR